MQEEVCRHHPIMADKSVWSALSLAWELGYLIAIPVALFGFGGAYLDTYFGTSPWCMLAGFVLAAALSFLAVMRKVKGIEKEQESE